MACLKNSCVGRGVNKLSVAVHLVHCLHAWLRVSGEAFSPAVAHRVYRSRLIWLSEKSPKAMRFFKAAEWL
eukprot:1768169-Alexandrium_andersonii.AAC.1